MPQSSGSSTSRDAAARIAYDYLAATDVAPASPADAVIGFGMFDLGLAAFCGTLHSRGQARHVIFTGGIGAGTGNLGQPEADAWSAALFRAYPRFPRSQLLVENRSTNTAENIDFTAALLAREHPALSFGRGIRSALIVASPSRLRRVRLTLRKLQPNLQVARCLPPTNFAREAALYASQGVDYIDHLAGELDRLVDYPARGWIAIEPLPPEVAGAHAVLRTIS